MSEKVMRCRRKLSAAIRRALGNSQQITTNSLTMLTPVQSRPYLCSAGHRHIRPRGPSSMEPTEENAKKGATTAQVPETDKRGNIYGANMVSKKENALSSSGAQRAARRSVHRDKSEGLSADLIPSDISGDLIAIIDQTSPWLIQQLAQSPRSDNNVNVDRDLIFGPGSFLSLISDDKEPPTWDHNDLETMMTDNADMTEEDTKLKSYFIL